MGSKATFDDMVKFLDNAWSLKSEIVPCLVGPVGIGKTAAVRQHAVNVGARTVVTIIASQILPSEVSGITMPDNDTKSMEIYDHYKLGHLQDGDIIFFDELLEADQSVLSACLTLIESRMLMSGKLLPDVQIIAATNPTVQPASIKENIRQRFMFMEFGYDIDMTHNYILKECGLDVPHNVLIQIESSSSQYNILSPRSLTKLCKWIMAVNEDQLDDVAMHINRMWNSEIGYILKNTRLNQQASKPKSVQAKEAIAKILDASNVELILPDNKSIDDCTFTELMEFMQRSPEWDSFAKELEKVEIHDPSEFDHVVNF